MASMEWTGPIVDFKLKVIRYLKGQLVGALFEELKDTIQTMEKVPPFYLEQCKTFEKLWEALEQRQLVRPKIGDCGFLKECFKRMEQQKWIDRVTEYEDEIKVATIVKNDAPSNDPSLLPEYKITADPRGLCVIINNREFHEVDGAKHLENRQGSDVDANKLSQLFTKLKFRIQNYTDLSSKDIMDVVEKVASADHRQNDCLVFFILTHGSDGCVYGTDGLEVKIRDITFYFKGCETLRTKPKLLFIQACQGTIHQMGFRTDGPNEDPSFLPIECDFLIGYATLPGCVSYRSETEGTWYIGKLVEVLEERCNKDDLLSILTKVNEEVAKGNAMTPSGGIRKQCPLPYTTLRKKVFLRNY